MFFGAAFYRLPMAFHVRQKLPLHHGRDLTPGDMRFVIYRHSLLLIFKQNRLI
jgi:hypothetical protein